MADVQTSAFTYTGVARLGPRSLIDYNAIAETPANPDVAARHAAQPAWKRRYRKFIAYRIAADTRKKFDVRVRGLAGPDTDAIPVIGINHKNDDDPVIMLAGILDVPGMLPLFRCSVFALGEHVFQPGFLGAYIVKEPRWLSFLLFHVNIARILKRMGAYPVVHARSRYLISHLNDVLEMRGNVALEDVLVGDAGKYIRGISPDAKIKSVLSFGHRDELYTLYDFPIFKPPLDQLLWERQQERIRAFVSTLGSLADTGRVVVTAPEGMFTRDGKPERMRSGLFQIVNSMKKDAALIPMNVTYDFMGPGRPIAYVTFGKSFPLQRGIPRDEFNAQVANALYRDAPIPMSQLAAEILRAIALQGESSVAIDDLRGRLRARGRELATGGYAVLPNPDDDEAFHAGVDRLIGYFKKLRCTIDGGVIQFDRDVILDETIQKNGYARHWWYCYNELQARLAQPHGDFG